MRTDELDYELPSEAIAQTPLEPRDAARLLVDTGTSSPVAHRHVRDLPDLLRAGDLVVVNDTRVIPARLHLEKESGGKVEVLWLEATGDPSEGWWEALVRPSRRVPAGLVLTGAGGALRVEVGVEVGDGRRLVRMLGGDAVTRLDEHGVLPLPPYIHEPLVDDSRYQTVFADRARSTAAPTAGLHLTPEVLARIEAQGVPVVTVELAIGLDTFRPVQCDDLEHHPMHSERYRVPEATWKAVQAADRVVAIGTTVVRTLESAAATGELEGRTDLFIRRPYSFEVVGALLTNFHLPRTTLLALIDAFIGPRWKDLYQLALDEGYRFLSFGDAMWLEKAGLPGKVGRRP